VTGERRPGWTDKRVEQVQARDGDRFGDPREVEPIVRREQQRDVGLDAIEHCAGQPGRDLGQGCEVGVERFACLSGRRCVRLWT